MPPKKRKQVKPADKPTKQRRTQSTKAVLPPSHEDPDSRPGIQQAGPSYQNQHGQQNVSFNNYNTHVAIV